MSFKILIADDEDVSALIGWLNSIGFHEISVENYGNRLESAMTTHVPNVVILDSFFEETDGTNGLDVLKEIKLKKTENSKIPVISMTQYGSENLSIQENENPQVQEDRIFHITKGDTKQLQKQLLSLENIGEFDYS